MPTKLLRHLYIILAVLTGCTLASTIYSCGSSAVGPVISSEDGELDNAGNDIPTNELPSNACAEDKAKQITMRVSAVDNGVLTQDGENGPLRPAILNIGDVFGFDGVEPQTLLHLDFVTDSTDWLVGADPGVYAIFLYLILGDLSLATQLNTDYVANEQVLNSGGTWFGNRVARWDDPFALFDAQILNLDETYILQACLGVLEDPVTHQPTQVRSQPIFIKARLNTP